MREIVVPILLAAAAGAACSSTPESGPQDTRVARSTEAVSTGTTLSTPIGLAVEVENGVGKPVSVRAGQTMYLNQIDLRVFANTTVDEGVRALTTSGDFASLDWDDLREVDEAP